MRAVWYERNGAADVLHVGEMPDPTPGPGEVRVRIVTSGINPSDWKRRQGLTRRMEFPRVIPHQDGAQVIATVSSDQKAQIALAAGGDDTVNSRTEDTVQRLRGEDS
jgi:NADPH2:quinone reductase